MEKKNKIPTTLVCVSNAFFKGKLVEEGMDSKATYTEAEAKQLLASKRFKPVEEAKEIFKKKEALKKAAADKKKASK